MTAFRAFGSFGTLVATCLLACAYTLLGVESAAAQDVPVTHVASDFVHPRYRRHDVDWDVSLFEAQLGEQRRQMTNLQRSGTLVTTVSSTDDVVLPDVVPVHVTNEDYAVALAIPWRDLSTTQWMAPSELQPARPSFAVGRGLEQMLHCSVLELRRSQSELMHSPPRSLLVVSKCRSVEWAHSGPTTVYGLYHYNDQGRLTEFYEVRAPFDAPAERSESIVTLELDDVGSIAGWQQQRAVDGTVRASQWSAD